MGTRSRNHHWDVTILAADSTSTISNSFATYGDSASLIVESPAILPETIKFQVCSKNNAVDTDTWVDWWDGMPPALETLPDPGTARPYPLIVPTGSIRLAVVSGTVADDRVFRFSSSGTY